MTEIEALKLCLEMFTANAEGSVKRLANGDFIVEVDDLFLWSVGDWEKYRRGSLPALKARKQEKVEA